MCFSAISDPRNAGMFASYQSNGSGQLMNEQGRKLIERNWLAISEITLCGTVSREIKKAFRGNPTNSLVLLDRDNLLAQHGFQLLSEPDTGGIASYFETGELTYSGLQIRKHTRDSDSVISFDETVIAALHFTKRKKGTSVEWEIFNSTLWDQNFTIPPPFEKKNINIHQNQFVYELFSRET